MGKLKISLILFLFTSNYVTLAGPPFQTDDPEPVDYKHWEYYISSMNTFQPHTFSGTLPHFEVNYGLVHNVQIHILLPFNYTFQAHQGMQYGYGYTEFGLKYRFVQETEHSPQIGTFPILEIPTVPANGFNNGRIQLYLPLWLQKSWNKLTTYGGGGYWINPGDHNKNWTFIGWEIQYDFAEALTLGGELYYHSAQTSDSQSSVGFNAGGIVNFSSKVHFIFSIGHTIFNKANFNVYAGLLVTI
jgi:hypothetical protein